MTTYTTITNALVAVGAKPFATTIQALRDNPIAIAEQDPSVPDALKLGHWFLGSLTTTSGSTQTLSGLNLTGFRFLVFSVNAVSSTNIAATLRLNGVQVMIITDSASANTGTGGGFIDLVSGVFWGAGVCTSFNGGAGQSGLTTASTSISFTTSVGTFDAGSIRIYGVK